MAILDQIFLIGVTSVWISVPALLSLGTPSNKLSQLTPVQAFLRKFLLLETLLASTTSLVAWQRWNMQTAAVDQVCAYVCVIGCMSFALMRGGIASWSLLFGVLAVAEFCAESFAADYMMERFQRWPHFIFRVLGFFLVFTALNGGVLINSMKQLIAVWGISVIIFFGYVFLEMQISHPVPPDADGAAYMAGVARCAISAVVEVLCCLYFLRVCCAVSDVTPGKCDQGAGPYSSLIYKSSELVEKAERNADANVDNSPTMWGA